MYRYSISFDADAIDETRLRDLLASHLGVETCSISRSAIAGAGPENAPAQEPSALEGGDPILEYAATVDMFAPRDVSRSLPDLEVANVARRCVTLVGQGKLHRVAHGIYSRAPASDFSQADVEANRALRSVEAPREVSKAINDNLLEFLATGRRGAEVQEFLGVSRQRTYQRLDDLMKQGLVCRVPGPDNCFIYALDQRSVPAESKKEKRNGQPKLTSNMRAILAVLPESGVVPSKLILKAANISQSGLAKGLNRMVAKGLIETPRIGLHRCVTLTKEGRASPVRSEKAERLHASDPTEIFGSSRASILKVLARHGSMTKPEISEKLNAAGLDSDGVQQALADMKITGLVERIPTSDHVGVNKLTKSGRDVVELFHRFALPAQDEATPDARAEDPGAPS